MDLIYGHETDIVPIAFVFGARIAQADDQFHGVPFKVERLHVAQCRPAG
jgi:hypothetical protein